MSLVVNGTTISEQGQNVVVNGVAVDSVVANGTEVWHRQESFTVYADNDTSAHYATSGTTTVGNRSQCASEYGNSICRLIEFYAKSGTSGGWAGSYVSLNYDGDSFSGSSYVNVNGANYGMRTSGGNIAAYCGGVTGSYGVSVSGGVVTGSSSATDAYGNLLEIVGFSGGLLVKYTESGSSKAITGTNDFTQYTYWRDV